MTRVFLVLLLLWFGLPAFAEQPSLFEALGSLLKPKVEPVAEAVPSTRKLPPIPAATGGERRVALVIGNNDYTRVPKLEKAVNDAKAVAQALEQAKFETILVENGNRTQINSAINQFADEIAGGGIGVFFFAGHGVQVNNQNFLIPVDLQEVKREADIADQAISLQGLQDKLAEARAKFSLLVIDACRDNPLPKKAGRALGGTRGLVQASSAEGQMVVFSAGANQQALDKLDDADQHPNGVFTRELLPYIKRPGVSIRDAVLEVRSAVRARAKSVNHEQFPAIYDQAEGNFYFIFQGSANVTVQPASADPESETWQAAQRANTEGAYRSYLDSYPNGRFATAAKIALDAAKKPVAAPEPAKSTETAKPTQAAVPPAPTFTSPAPDDPEGALWAEVKSSGAKEYYDAYLKQYPRGKYAALARLELKKIDDREKAEKAKEDAERKAQLAREDAERKAIAERERQESVRAEQELWDSVKQGDTLSSYGRYLETYPKGRYATLAQAAQSRLQREATEREKREAAQRLEDEKRQRADAERQRLIAEREAREAEQRRQVEAERQRLAAEQERREAEKAAKEMRAGKVFKDCGDCPEMVVIPGGIAVGRTEVTQGQWRTVMGNNPSHFSSCGDTCPVEKVSWDDAQDYVRKLNQKTGKTYRLPSEAEWERACRAGSQQDYCGSDNIDGVAWYNGNSGSKTHAVAGKQANVWGLYDMSGNVWEWTDSCYNSDCSGRVLRGGSWDFVPQVARAANRGGSTPGVRDYDNGFRLARTLLP